jgi:hypothetical protein
MLQSESKTYNKGGIFNDLLGLNTVIHLETFTTAYWQNDILTKWLFDNMACWPNDIPTKWYVDEMTHWEND